MDKFAGALIFAAGLMVGHNLGVFQGGLLIKADQLEKRAKRAEDENSYQSAKNFLSGTDNENPA